MIKLGDRARDTITGFEGIVVAETMWIHGCRRLTVQPEKLTKDGELPKVETFDENQLTPVEAKVHTDSAHGTGGPRPDVERY